MITTGSFEKSYEVALKICEYLGIDNSYIGNKYHSSLYIVYSHNWNNYQIRVSDHCANPWREDATKTLGYTSVSVGDDWRVAKNIIDREILGIKPIIPVGATIDHPRYGEGKAVAYDVDKNRLYVDFNGDEKSFYGTVIIDRGWLKA